MAESQRMQVEQQLAQYRLRKKREAESLARKQKWREFFMSFFTFKGLFGGGDSSSSSSSSSSLEPEGEETHTLGATGESSSLAERRRRKAATSSSEQPPPTLEDPPAVQYTSHDWLVLGLKCCLWLVLQKVFILLEFGAVFFIFSAFVFIWYNLRNEPRRKGEASAYSVFNPNCETIDGTFTAEQFERELLHKM